MHRCTTRTSRRTARAAVIAAALTLCTASCTGSADEPEDPATATPAGTSDTGGAAESAPAAEMPSTITPGEPFVVTAPDGWQFIHTAFTVSGPEAEIMVSTSDDGASPQEGYRDVSETGADVDALIIEVGPQATLIIPESVIAAGSYEICGPVARISASDFGNQQQICAEADIGN